LPSVDTHVLARTWAALTKLGNSVNSAWETLTAPPACVASDNRYLSSETDYRSTRQIAVGGSMPYQNGASSLLRKAQPAPIHGVRGRISHAMAKLQSGYFNTRQLGTAAIISSGHWHEHWRNPQKGKPLLVHRAVCILWPICSLQIEGRRTPDFCCIVPPLCRLHYLNPIPYQIPTRRRIRRRTGLHANWALFFVLAARGHISRPTCSHSALELAWPS
jgi:hypothetical protein